MDDTIIIKTMFKKMFSIWIALIKKKIITINILIKIIIDENIWWEYIFFFYIILLKMILENIQMKREIEELVSISNLFTDV